MAVQTDRSRTLLDILIIAWLLSIIPVILEFIHSAPGFPDVAPNDSPALWVCVGIFILLQLSIALTILTRYRITAWSLLLAICLPLLALLPETIVFILALLLYPLAIIAIAILAFGQAARLIKRRRSSSRKTSGARRISRK